LNAAQTAWFEDQQAKAAMRGDNNPCVKLYGLGPDGARCKTCTLLFRRGQYFKCRLRNLTSGPGSDHRANWPACGKYVKKPPQAAP